MWPTLIPLLGGLLDKILPDAKAAADAKLRVMEMAQQGQLAQLDADVKLATGQIDVNKVEAGSSNAFVSGARPFIMWVCGVAFAYAAILEPIGRFVAVVVYGYAGAFPVIDTNLTMQVLLGLLGLGVMRSYDKKQGTAS